MIQPFKRLAAFRRSEKGNATVEFAIVFPFFMMLLTSAFELGVINLRQTALDSRLESAMRVVRINTGTQYTHDDIKTMICTNAPMLGDCSNNLRLEMVPADPRNYTPLASDAGCLDTDSTGSVIPSGQPNFNLGNANQLVLVRACLIFNPILPSSYLAADRIAGEAGGSNNLAAVVSMSGFTQEPR